MAVLPPGTLLQLMYLSERLQNVPAGRFIEIGPGSGEITRLLLDHGWTGSSYDLEGRTIDGLRQRFSREMSEGRFMPINHDFLLASSDEVGKADLVISCMVMEHMDDHGQHSFMRINVSAADLQRLEFVEDVREALASAGLDPSLLVLELTESAVIQGNDLDRYTLNSLRRLGIEMEIDDFGTGYSSIDYLRRLPVHAVKVDRTLLSALGSDPAQPALLAAVLQLIRACGLGDRKSVV